jgi:ParB family transcriptional regulator, chromosome partitioning protein
MKLLHGGQVQRFVLDQIEIVDRLRTVNEDSVENLIVMAEDSGITTPIHVRKVKGRLVLIDGAHRLEAVRRMALSDIAALVWECRADEARAMEASNNLGAARMTPLQTVVFVASWKRDYYTQHPERKPGIFKGNQHTGNLVGVNLTLTKTIAETFGVSEATAKRALMAGDKLVPEEIRLLESAPCRITMEILKGINKVGEPIDRLTICKALADGTAKSAKEVMNRKKAPGAAKTDKVESDYRKISDAFARSSLEARRRFVDEWQDDLQKLINAHDAGPGEVIQFKSHERD